MNKAVLISIRPKWCELIASGKKTVEVRKTRPKIDVPFKCYIYCTKAKEALLDVVKDGDKVFGDTYRGKTQFIKSEEGSVCDMWGKRQKVIGEFVCNQIDTYDDTIHAFSHEEYSKWNDFDLYNSCIHPEDFERYANDNWLYGWHISDLVIYDEPKELGEFGKPNICHRGVQKEDCIGCWDCEITRPPQSWCYVEEQTAQD